MRIISHDTFARTSIVRRNVENPPASGCKWCGGFNRRGGLYEYSVQPDSFGARERPIRGVFCSIECMRAYD